MVALRDPRRPLSRACWAEKYEPLDRAADFADSMRVVRSHLEPLRVLPDRCLPADSSLPGHIPGPGGQASGGPELAPHVHPDLGDDRLGRAPVPPGDGVKP